jgi:GntR family transcriptional regulator
MVAYRRIVEHIRAELAHGSLVDGQPLPGEWDLCRTYGVSRTTIRAALGVLERDGIIRREQGRGTFLCAPAIRKHLGSLVDFHTEAIAAGRVPHTRVLALTERQATARERALFAGTTDSVIDLDRVRSLDGVPAVLQRSTLPAEIFGEVAPAALEDASLYTFLLTQRGIIVTAIEETLEPVAIEARAADLLSVAVGTPVFRSARVARTATGRVVELSENLIRGDLYRFHVTRTADQVWS